MSCEHNSLEAIQWLYNMNLEVIQLQYYLESWQQKRERWEGGGEWNWCTTMEASIFRHGEGKLTMETKICGFEGGIRELTENSVTDARETASFMKKKVGAEKNAELTHMWAAFLDQTYNCCVQTSPTHALEHGVVLLYTCRSFTSD